MRSVPACPARCNAVPIVSNNNVNNFIGTASVEKNFDRVLLVLGETVNQTNYDDSMQRGRDGTIYTTTGRLGYWITPYLNAYVQGSGDWRRYAAGDVFDSNGYRVVGGVATPQVGLLQGEVYGGYQAERYDNGLFSTVSSSVYGGKLSYFPTRYWTIKLRVDRTISVSTLAPAPTVGLVAPASPVIGTAVFGTPLLGTPMTVTTARLETDWGLWRLVSVSGRFGYDHATYTDSFRVDEAWYAGTKFNFNVWQAIGLSLDYQYTRLNSNVPLNSYYKNVIMLGAMYRY
jgi:hypothetical protein